MQGGDNPLARFDRIDHVVDLAVFWL